MKFLAFFISFRSFSFVTLKTGKLSVRYFIIFFFKVEGRYMRMRIILILSINKVLMKTCWKYY